MMRNGFEKQFSEPHAQGKLNSWYDGFTTLQAYLAYGEVPTLAAYKQA